MIRETIIDAITLAFVTLLMGSGMGWAIAAAALPGG